MSPNKKRLDRVVVEKKLAHSRHRARALIMAGKVLVNNHLVDKPGTQVSTEDVIVLKGEDSPYVSRGGLKLESALQAMEVDITGFTCLDVGASTGGFTDCLLQHGASRVFAVDVGYGQLAWQLRQDPRVVVIERTNIRHMPAEKLPQLVDLVTIDVSFISLKKVVPEILKFMKKGAGILSLIKPQFEVGKGEVGKGGVVRDLGKQQAVIKKISDFAKKHGLLEMGTTSSPITGPKGNQEFLTALKLPE
jgi:23S rRNA (cytidine1920-2'-O)/16S rRNA (cytidine1409-2'-O)-methyltransferase